jgi:uncharacterized protein YcbX
MAKFDLRVSGLSRAKDKRERERFTPEQLRYPEIIGTYREEFREERINGIHAICLGEQEVAVVGNTSRCISTITAELGSG